MNSIEKMLYYRKTSGFPVQILGREFLHLGRYWIPI